MPHSPQITKRWLGQLGFVVLTALLLSSAAQAQTALIAHRSHGGAARTFRPDQSAHNFGEIAPPLTPVELVYLQGAQVVRYRERWYGSRQIGSTVIDTVDIRALTGEYQPTPALARLRELYPKAKLVGFEQKKIRETWPSKP